MAENNLYLLGERGAVCDRDRMVGLQLGFGFVLDYVFREFSSLLDMLGDYIKNSIVL